jgi:transcriptional regulator with XRE-family HTH domain
MSFAKDQMLTALDPEGFGSWLRRSREARGLEKKELAVLTQIRPGTLTEVEMGRLTPASGVELFARIAHGLGLELAYVLHKAGYDVGKGAVNMARLERVEMIIEDLDVRTPDIRRAMAEAMDRLDAVGDDSTANELGRALGALDLVTERIREGRKVT